MEQLGPQLSKLNLVHVEELDFRAVKILSLTCTNINTLGLYNCGFREPTPADDEVRILSHSNLRVRKGRKRPVTFQSQLLLFRQIIKKKKNKEP